MTEEEREPFVHVTKVRRQRVVGLNGETQVHFFSNIVAEAIKHSDDIILLNSPPMIRQSILRRDGAQSLKKRKISELNDVLVEPGDIVCIFN